MFQVSVENVRGGDKEHVQIIQGVVVMADNIEKVEEDVRRTDNEVQKKHSYLFNKTPQFINPLDQKLVRINALMLL